MKVTTAIILATLGLGAEAQFGGFGQPAPGQPKGAPCGKGLQPCHADLYCKKLDTNCFDIRNEGNCIGSCQPKGFGGSTPGSNGAAPISQSLLPKGFPAPQPQVPSYPQPFAQPAPAAAQSTGLLGGLSNLLGGNRNPPSPQQLPPPSPPAQQQSGGLLSNAFGNTITPITIRQCPSNMRCGSHDVCVPHPRQPDRYLCVSADVECGRTLLVFNKSCPAGQSCLANPKYTCDRTTGICAGNDGICVPPPPN